MSGTVEVARRGPAHAPARPGDQGPDVTGPVVTIEGDEPDSAPVRALVRLREALDSVMFPLAVTSAVDGAAERDASSRQIEDYLVPRLRRLDAPLLAVVGGSTGAGKSTLVNSLLRVQVSRTGVLRPTTRSPVLVHHPRDAEWFGGRRVLPGLARDFGADEPLVAGERITAMRLVSSDALPPGLALLDAPDIDSVVADNRAVAAQLLAAADLWIFLTTAARYADAVPWAFLHDAAQRSAALAVVLNRVPPAGVRDVQEDLARLLAANGLGATPVFTINEGETESGLLPREVVAPLQQWLAGLAQDGAARSAVVRRTLAGALAALAPRVGSVAAAADDQADAARHLRTVAVDAFTAAGSRFEASLAEGNVLRGEVLARWHDIVGTGDLMRQIEGGIGQARDKLVAFVLGRPTPTRRLEESLSSAAYALITAEVGIAHAETRRSWAGDRAGAALLVADPTLGVASPDLDERVERVIRDWQAAVLDLVRAQGSGRRRTARALSLGVNASGVVLMLFVFSTTGGLSFTEAGIAAGTAALSQRLLEAVFGDQAVRELAAAARRDLLSRVDGVLAIERDRWVDAVPTPHSGEDIRTAGSGVPALP